MYRLNFLRSMALAVLALSAFGACAPHNHVVALDPRTDLDSSEVGAGVRVVVRTVDARKDQTHLGVLTHSDERQAQIVGEPSLVEVIRDRILKGLRTKGFDAVEPGPEAPVALTVEVAEFDYSGRTRTMKSDVRATVVLHVKAGRFDAKYEKSYRVENEQEVSFVPTPAENEGLINQALAQVLKAMLSDEKLLGFLAQGPSQETPVGETE